MAADEGVDERAERDDPLPAGARVVERAGDERRAEAAALDARIDLGVQERDDVVAALAVDELARVRAADQQLVAALLGAVLDGDVVLGQTADATAARRDR